MAAKPMTKEEYLAFCDEFFLNELPEGVARHYVERLCATIDDLRGKEDNVRRTDTQGEAWEEAQRRQPTQQKRVLDYLTRNGPSTCSEVEAGLGGTHQGISATINALVAKGRARDTGARRTNVRGLNERVVEACRVEPPGQPRTFGRWYACVSADGSLLRDGWGKVALYAARRAAEDSSGLTGLLRPEVVEVVVREVKP